MGQTKKYENNGELLPKLRKMVKPITTILNNIVKTGLWPEKWKIEFGTAIPKNEEKVDENDARIISITNHISKLIEKFVFQRLMEFIGHKLDKDQFGATQGNSITHYLIELVNFFCLTRIFKIPEL